MRQYELGKPFSQRIPQPTQRSEHRAYRFGILRDGSHRHQPFDAQTGQRHDGRHVGVESLKYRRVTLPTGDLIAVLARLTGDVAL